MAPPSANGSVNQTRAADLLGVTRMSVINWVRAGKVKRLKLPGHPSAVPLTEVKRVKPAGTLRLNSVADATFCGLRRRPQQNLSGRRDLNPRPPEPHACSRAQRT